MKILLFSQSFLYALVWVGMVFGGTKNYILQFIFLYTWQLVLLHTYLKILLDNTYTPRNIFLPYFLIINNRFRAKIRLKMLYSILLSSGIKQSRFTIKNSYSDKGLHYIMGRGWLNLFRFKYLIYMGRGILKTL